MEYFNARSFFLVPLFFFLFFWINPLTAEDKGFEKERFEIKIGQGDNLFRLAIRYYHSGTYVPLIKRINRMENDLIICGHNLWLAGFREAAEFDRERRTKVVLQPKGDTLPAQKAEFDPFSLPVLTRLYTRPDGANFPDYPFSQLVRKLILWGHCFPKSMNELLNYQKKYYAGALLYPLGGVFPDFP